MSHIATVTVETRDLECLARAAKRCGVELRHNQKSYRWYGSRPNECDHVIAVPGNEQAYEIGVIKSGDGYNLEFDPFLGGYGLMPLVSNADNPNDIGKLLQFYAIEVVKKQAAESGAFLVETLNTETGDIYLEYQEG